MALRLGPCRRGAAGRTFDEEGSREMPAAAAAASSGSNWRGGGVGCRRSSAHAEKARRMCSATVQLASSIISSTIWFASRIWGRRGFEILSGCALQLASSITMSSIKAFAP